MYKSKSVSLLSKSIFLSQNISISSSIQSMNAYLSVNARGRRILIDPVDRISQLPDNVLVMILKQMITEDAVRTSVLSKRWKSVWKQVPYLFFDMRYAFLRNMEPLPSHSNRVAKLITQVFLCFLYLEIFWIIVLMIELMITLHFDLKKKCYNQIHLDVSIIN